MEYFVVCRKCTLKELCTETSNHKIYYFEQVSLGTLLLLILDFHNFSMPRIIYILDVELLDMLLLKLLTQNIQKINIQQHVIFIVLG